MAQGKKSFLIYCDIIHSIDHLTNEEKGILFQHLLEYVNDMNPVLEDRLLLTAWKPIERQLKRDLVKYEETRERNRQNAKKRWDKNNATACDRMRTDAKHADNDNDNDNVNDINNIYQKFVDEVKKGGFDSRIDAMYMRLKLRPNTLTPLLKEFKLHVIEENRVHENIEAFFINFKNWLNTQDRIKKLDKYKI